MKGMPSYKKLKKAELAQICVTRGINPVTCRTKADLIAALEQNDMRNDAIIDDNNTEYDDLSNNDDGDSVINYEEPAGGDDVESSDGSAEEGDDGGNGVNERSGVCVLPRQGDVESDSVATLRLQLALAQEQRKMRKEERLLKEREWEMERERVRMRSEGQGPAQTTTGATDFKEIKAILPSMHDVEIVGFFQSFERILELNEVDRALWARLLPSQLSPRALKAYARLSLEETKNYDTVKRIILQSYNLDSNYYLRTFRSMRRTGNSSYSMFLTNLREMMERYLDSKNINTFEALKEDYLREQYLSSLKDNVRSFVISKKPASALECAQMSDLWYEISRIGKDTERRDFGQRSSVVEGQSSVRPNFGPARQTGNFGAAAPLRPMGQNGEKFRPNNMVHANRFAGPNNYNGNKQHVHESQGRPNRRGAFFASDDVHRPNMYGVRENDAMSNDREYATERVVCNNDVVTNACDDDDENCVRSGAGNEAMICDRKYIFPVIINNQIQCEALRDSGSMLAVILDESLIPEKNVDYQKTTVTGAFDGGTEKTVPTTKITISSPWFGNNKQIVVTAAVTKLPKRLCCVLGNSFYSRYGLKDMIHVKNLQEMQTFDSLGKAVNSSCRNSGHSGQNERSDSYQLSCRNNEDGLTGTRTDMSEGMTSAIKSETV